MKLAELLGLALVLSVTDGFTPSSSKTSTPKFTEDQQTHSRLRYTSEQSPVMLEPEVDSTFLNFHHGQGRIQKAFAKSKLLGEAAFVTFVTAGYPSADETPSILLAMQEGGADIIELGIPYSDPQADGPTIQVTNQVAIEGGTSDIDQCLEMLKKARSMGLTVPVVLMGYFNPFFQYGVDELCESAQEAGADGFIVVDLPPAEGVAMNNACVRHGLSNIPLVAPTTSDKRIAELAKMASTFLYCVSVTGVTGARPTLPDNLEDFIVRVRRLTGLPLAVGFGISSPEMVNGVANISDGVVVGSAVLKAIDKLGKKATAQERYECTRNIIAHLKAGSKQSKSATNQATKLVQIPAQWDTASDTKGSRFGKFGGQYIPETLSAAFENMEKLYNQLKVDPEFIAELDEYRRDYVGGPTPLYKAENLSKFAGGATIWLKREDLAHTGAHKINNAIGQALMAKRAGMNRIIAETGAGQHGVAVATVCAKLGMKCTIYMGNVDCERQNFNVQRMKILGAEVVPVFSGQGTLKDAINEAMRDWVTNVHDTHYLIGSVVGPHPGPTVVRDFQSVIGREMKTQTLDQIGKLPDAIVACVGGGSNAIGAFHSFKEDLEVDLYGVEAAGKGSDEEPCSTLSSGTPGVFHGAMTYLLQDKAGQTSSTSSISAGLDYPGVGPEHAFLKDIGRAQYSAVTDEEALQGFQWMSQLEGIIPALETSHAIYYAVQLAQSLGPDQDIVINMSGRGEKDLDQVFQALDME